MKTDGSGSNRVEIEGLHGLLDIGFQLFPVLGLGEDTLAEGFRCEAAVCLLRDLKDELIHAVSISCPHCSHDTPISSAEANVKRTSGVKTPVQKGCCVAGDESPAYRSRSAII